MGNQGRCGRPARPKRLSGRGWPRLAEARGSLEHDLPLREASGAPAGRGLSHVASHAGAASPKLVAPCTELAKLLLRRERRDEAHAMAERAMAVASPAQREVLDKLLQAIRA